MQLTRLCFTTALLTCTAWILTTPCLPALAAGAPVANPAIAAVQTMRPGDDPPDPARAIIRARRVTLGSDAGAHTRAAISQANITSTFTPASHVGRISRLIIEVQGTGLQPHSGFHMRVRLTPGYQPRNLNMNGDNLAKELHVRPDGFMSEHHVTRDGFAYDTLTFTWTDEVPGPREVQVELIPHPANPKQSQLVEAFSYVADQYDRPDLWSDLNLTWTKGKLTGKIHKRFASPTFRVHNTGLTASPKTLAHYFTSSGSGFTSETDTLIHTTEIPALQPGGSHKIRTRFNRQQVPSGYDIWLVLDPDNQVDEGNETNNVTGIGPN